MAQGIFDFAGLPTPGQQAAADEQQVFDRALALSQLSVGQQANVQAAMAGHQIGGVLRPALGIGPTEGQARATAFQQAQQAAAPHSGDPEAYLGAMADEMAKRGFGQQAVALRQRQEQLRLERMTKTATAAKGTADARKSAAEAALKEAEARLGPAYKDVSREVAKALAEDRVPADVVAEFARTGDLRVLQGKIVSDKRGWGPVEFIAAPDGKGIVAVSRNANTGETRALGSSLGAPKISVTANATAKEAGAAADLYDKLGGKKVADDIGRRNGIIAKAEQNFGLMVSGNQKAASLFEENINQLSALGSDLDGNDRKALDKYVSVLRGISRGISGWVAGRPDARTVAEMKAIMQGAKVLVERQNARQRQSLKGAISSAQQGNAAGMIDAVTEGGGVGTPAADPLTGLSPEERALVQKYTQGAK